MCRVKLTKYAQNLLKYINVCIKKFGPNKNKININFFESMQHNI